jgi:hypothetical protein
LGMRFFEKMTEKEFNKLWVDVVFQQQFTSHGEWLGKYGPQVDPDAASTTFALLSLYNSVGFLLKEDLVDPELLFSYVGPITIFRAWRKLEPLVKGWREKNNDPTFFDAFEYLYNEMSERYSQMTVFNI